MASLTDRFLCLGHCVADGIAVLCHESVQQAKQLRNARHLGCLGSPPKAGACGTKELSHGLWACVHIPLLSS